MNWQTGPFTAADFIAGSTVRFSDDGQVAQDSGPGVAEGVINGPAKAVPPVGFMVPVWSERDHGREPTTVWVDARNIVGIRFPEQPAKVARALPPSMRAAVDAAEDALASTIGDKPFTAGELDQVAEALASVLYTRHSMQALDPLEVESVRVLTDKGRHGVAVHLVDGRTFRVTLGHFTRPAE